MGRPEFKDDNMNNLLDELKRYVAAKYPTRKWLNACNWAFYPLNPEHYLGVNFWDFLKDDESMNDCLVRLKRDAVDKGTIQNPIKDAKDIF